MTSSLQLQSKTKAGSGATPVSSPSQTLTNIDTSKNKTGKSPERTLDIGKAMEELEQIKSKITSSKAIGNRNGTLGNTNQPRIGSANSIAYNLMKAADKTLVKKNTNTTNSEMTPIHSQESPGNLFPLQLEKVNRTNHHFEQAVKDIDIQIDAADGKADPDRKPNEGEETSHSRGSFAIEGIMNYKRPSNQFQASFPAQDNHKSTSSLISPMDSLKKGNKFKALKLVEDIENTWSNMVRKVNDLQKEASISYDLSGFTEEYMKLLHVCKEASKKM